MIKSIKSNMPSFKEIVFNPGFNVILAEKSPSASEGDTRNGVGKTTILEIIHFCLGGNPRETLKKQELKDWSFIMEFTMNGKSYVVERNLKNKNKVFLKGDFSDWPIKPEKGPIGYYMETTDWTKILGYFMFDLPHDFDDKQAIKIPSFRNLINYFARIDNEAFNQSDIFVAYKGQRTVQKQLALAYLLNLNWELISRLYILEEERKTLNTLKKALEGGLLDKGIGDFGELEVSRVDLQDKITHLEQQLKTFKVHPEYKKIEKEANELTEQIQQLRNERTLKRQLFDGYLNSIKEEDINVSIEFIEQIYKEAGLWFPEKVKKRLEDVKNFHETLIHNRKQYLSDEMTRLENEINNIEKEIEQLSEKRANLMKILESHGALEEYTNLSNRLSELKKEYNDIVNKIEQLKQIEQRHSDLKIEKEQLLKTLNKDFEERKEIRENIIRLFNNNSKALYDEQGTFSISIGKNGYKFKVDIKRQGSHSIGKMLIFCFDLLLIQLRSKEQDKPGFLFHDSRIFSDVDERQFSKALQLAKKEADEKRFQYICALNSDKVPYQEFSDDFKTAFRNSIIIELKDHPEDAGLLGFRF